MSTIVQNGEGVAYGQLVQMEVITCYSCGVPFGVPENLRRKFQETGDLFYCPNGHSQHYTKSISQKLKDQQDLLQRERERHQREINQKNERLAYVIRSRNAAKGQVTRIKNRIAAGVCPCCNRSFQNLKQHMANQHPDFKN